MSDLISRKDAIKIFGEVHPMDYNTQAYITKIQNLPPVTPQPKVGKWEIVICDLYMCSKCYGKYTYKSNFCPNCGAKMEVE